MWNETINVIFIMTSMYPALYFWIPCNTCSSGQDYRIYSSLSRLGLPQIICTVLLMPKAIWKNVFYN